MFGCGGNRSKLRRSGMGEICAKMADFSILTEDNNRPQVEGIQVSNLNKKNVSLLRAYAKSGRCV